MKRGIHRLHWKTLLLYLNDVIAIGDTFDTVALDEVLASFCDTSINRSSSLDEVLAILCDILNNRYSSLDEVLGSFCGANLKLKPYKCPMFQMTDALLKTCSKQ